MAVMYWISAGSWAAVLVSLFVTSVFRSPFVYGLFIVSYTFLLFAAYPEKAQ